MPAGASLRRTVAATLLVAATVAPAAASDPWIDRVRSFEPGTSAGFGAANLPWIVLGPPEGLGPNQGSLHVVSLGNGGRITVSFDDNAVVDGPGDDLVIYENAFVTGNSVFIEYAFVEVSTDGKEWVEFPWDPLTGEGLAGRTPVLANSANAYDPFDPRSGGDRFDLADVGLEFARFVRITDAGSIVDDIGNHTFAGNRGGFDLDAVGAIHSLPFGCIRGTVLSGGLPVAGARVRLRGAEGERWRGRRTGAAGNYRFCRLWPGVDYELRARRRGQSRVEDRVFLDEQQLHVAVDFVLP